MLVNYTNSSCSIFPGFYDTLLSDFNFDTEPQAPEGFEYDTRDFKKYMHDVGKLWTDELNASAAGDVIKNIKFVGIDSPRYYNYSTDKLELLVNINKRALNKYCYHEHATEFNDYLRENWSSRDGFYSFIPNNLNDFKRAENVEIMIEFYLLNIIDSFEDFELDIFEKLTGLQYEQYCLVDKNGVKYDYTISDDGESVILGEPIK